MTTATANAPINGSIDTQYGVASEQSGQLLPALQASAYQPKQTDQVKLVLSEDSVNLMNPEFIAKVATSSESCDYGSGESLMFAVDPSVRFIVLAMPKMYAMDKETKEIHTLQKGQKLKTLNRVTAARLLLAMVVGDELVLDNDGKPQIFTLKLTSTKTSLIGGDRDVAGASTIHSLNKSLAAHFNVKGQWLTHLVSLSLKVSPHRFTSSENGKSSVGVMFSLDGGARALSATNQKLCFELVSSNEFKALAKDPFRLSGKSEESEPEEGDRGIDDLDPMNAIPF